MLREQKFQDDILFKFSNKKRAEHNRIIIQKTLAAPSIEADEIIILKVSQTTSWMKPIIHYLHLEELFLYELEEKKI